MWKDISVCPIILQIIKSKGKFNVGINGEKFSELGEINIPSGVINKYNLKGGEYLKFKLNIMTNGELNSIEPLLLNSIDLVASENELESSYETTKSIFDALLNPVNIRIFMDIGDVNNPTWYIPSKELRLGVDMDNYNPGVNRLVVI